MTSLLGRLRAVLFRLTTLGRRDALDASVDQELAFHVEMLARDFERSGLSKRDAAAAARRKLGNPLVIRERAGEQWGAAWLEQTWQDVRYGTRILYRSRMFACIAIGAVGVAVGINTGFFTLVDALAWQPIPVARPERLVKLLAIDARRTTDLHFSVSQLAALATARSVTDIVAFDAQPAAAKYGPGSDAVTASVGIVSANYFTALGGRAAAGRLLSAADGVSGSQPAIVISDALWTRVYRRSRDAIGADVIINGVHATIAGVATADFVGVNPLVPDMWATIACGTALGVTPGDVRDPANRFLALHARLRPGVSMRAAESELSPLVAEPSAGRDSLRRVTGIALVPSASMLPNDAATAAMIAPALFVVVLVLVIACANLANLLLARALVRQREIAVRLALGASRTRVMRQLLTESAIIAIAGAALGTVIANWVVAAVSRAFLAAVPTTLGTVALSLRPSWHVLAYTAALAAISVLTFGLAPALQATTPNLSAALKGEDALFGRRVRRSRVRDALIAVQVAGSLVLLCAAAIIAYGVQSFAGSRTGLATDDVLVANIGLASSGHVSTELAERRGQFATRVQRLPQVAAMARADRSPYTTWPYTSVRADGERRTALAMQSNRVTPRYFEVVGQRLVQGRLFTAQDSAANASVVVVSESAAKALWPGQAALGQRLHIVVGADAADLIAEVVGVVRDAHSGMLWDDDSDGEIFQPASASDFASRDMPLLVRVRSGTAGVDAALAAVAREVDPNSPLQVDALTHLRAVQVMPFRYGAIVTSSVGILGLALALVGLYGMISYTVRQRQRDIAVHVAMGAAPRDVLRLILRRELATVLAGLGIGLVLSLGESALIDSLALPLPSLGLFRTLGVAAVLLGVAAIAAIVPARAALGVSPMRVLRQE